MAKSETFDDPTGTKAKKMALQLINDERIQVFAVVGIGAGGRRVRVVCNIDNDVATARILTEGLEVVLEKLYKEGDDGKDDKATDQR